MTQSTSAIRAAVMAAVKAGQDAWNADISKGYPLFVEYPNRVKVDLATQVNPYLAVDLVFGDATEMDLGAKPLVADIGNIVLAVGVKEGGGEDGLLQVLDYFRPRLQLRDDLGSGLVRTKVGKVQKAIPRLGFYFIPMIIPFWSQSVAQVNSP